MKKDKVYKQKQDWMDTVMACNDLSLATRVFAYGIFKHMYGVKVDAFPDTDDLEAATGLARSKFPTYRRALVASGALQAVKERRGKFKQENYTYTLNLDWEGHVPTRDTAIESHVPTGNQPCTQKELAMFPQGTSHVPTGDSNTTRNPPSNPSMEDDKDDVVREDKEGDVVVLPTPLTEHDYAADYKMLFGKDMMPL